MGTGGIYSCCRSTICKDIQREHRKRRKGLKHIILVVFPPPRIVAIIIAMSIYL